ncbi:MAG: aldolase [Firmicutes bacterium]|nr:aldolase [Candidatus Caballimonas caccae]
MLKLMYITNKPRVAKIADKAGVDRIFVDMEYIGKDDRQKGLNSVKNRHTLKDVKRVKSKLKKAELLVRVNPIHDETDIYTSSETEINGAIENGADIIMLPFFKTVEEVKRFIKAVDGRAKTMLLLETKSAVDNLDEILQVKGIDEIHIGLNDLSIDLKKKFMFEPLADGLVDVLCEKIRDAEIPYGFGGIARLNHGEIPSQNIIVEHYRLGSSFAILSRSFCNVKTTSFIKIKMLFKRELKKIRKFERKVSKTYTSEQIENNRIKTIELINEKKDKILN